MSTSNNIQQYTLSIRVSEAYIYLVNISIFDSNNRLILNTDTNIYEKNYSLNQGLYSIRVELNGEIRDTVIVLDEDKKYVIADNDSSVNKGTIVITPPRQYSSALLGETYASSHEYYTGPAIEWSTKNTIDESSIVSNNSTSSLFIFLRFPSYEKFQENKQFYSESLFNCFELVDENGHVITKFDNQNSVRIHKDHGWLAFNVQLSDGVYYLMYSGKEPRQIPIYVFKNWHTQFFLTLGKESLFGTIRIFLSRERKFEYDNKINRFIDILLDKLQNQDYNLDKELINMAAYGKIDSPMLGLICSYIYLKSKNTKDDSLFKSILQNMENIILRDNAQSPDLRALQILASNHFSRYPYEKASVQGTPMFRVGFEAILEASIKNNILIPQNSINDYVSENLYSDSPFNTFKPIPFQSQITISQTTSGASNFKNIIKQMSELMESDTAESNSVIDFNKMGKIMSKFLEGDSKEDISDNDFKKIKRKMSKFLKNDHEDDWSHVDFKKVKKQISKFLSSDVLKLQQFSSEDDSIQSEISSKIDKYTTSIVYLLDKSLFDVIQNYTESDTENSWVKTSIADILQKNGNITIDEISSMLSISGNTVSRILDEWQNEVGKIDNIDGNI